MLKADDSAAANTVDSAESQQVGSPLLLYAVLTLTVLYCGFLMGLALLTSNPIVLNPHQIRDSSLIVSGTLESSDDRGVTIRIEEIWKGKADTDVLFVRDLSVAQLEGSDAWIFPLRRVSPTDYVVTPWKDGAPAVSKPLLYPADPDTLNKLKSLLSSDRPSL